MILDQTSPDRVLLADQLFARLRDGQTLRESAAALSLSRGAARRMVKAYQLRSTVVHAEGGAAMSLPTVQAFRPNSDGDTWRYTTEPRWVHAQRCICAMYAAFRGEMAARRPWAKATLREIAETAYRLRARQEWL